MAVFGIVCLSVIPVRETSSHRAEMVSQLLFGETVTILKEEPNWLYISNTADHYLGWVERKQITLISTDDYNYWNSIPKLVACKPMDIITVNGNQTILPAGSIVPMNSSFTLSSTTFNHNIKQKEKSPITVVTNDFINAPYLWGGKTLMGFDCSGFSQVMFKIAGIDLPRDASQQSNLGTTVDFIEEVIPGDLGFFDNEEGKIIHVGIFLSTSQMMHASGCVRIDKIDHHGIYNPQIGGYSHQLRFIKRVLP